MNFVVNVGIVFIDIAECRLQLVLDATIVIHNTATPAMKSPLEKNTSGNLDTASLPENWKKSGAASALQPEKLKIYNSFVLVIFYVSFLFIRKAGVLKCHR